METDVSLMSRQKSSSPSKTQQRHAPPEPNPHGDQPDKRGSAGLQMTILAPSTPQNPWACSVRTVCRRRRWPTALFPSHTSTRGALRPALGGAATSRRTGPRPPATGSALRSASGHSQSPAPAPAAAPPTGSDRTHRHRDRREPPVALATSPAAYAVRDVGSGGR